MLGMGFSDKPVAYEYSVHDHADMHEALLATSASSPRTSWPTTSVTRSARRCWRARVLATGLRALRIESITWLNGGLFNETYTPRLLQKVLSRTPLGDILSPLQGSRCRGE